MTPRIDRRTFIAAAGATLAAPAVVRAQAPALRIGVMLPRSGFFAQAGQSCHRGALAAPRVLADLGYLSSATAETIATDETALEAETPALPAPAEPRALPERASDASPTVVSAALAASCDMMVRRALERAGARLRSAAGKRTPGGAASIQCDDPSLLHTSLEATAYADLGTLLEGAWSLVPEIADRYGADPALLEDTLDTYTRALIATQQEHRYGRLALALGSA